MASVEEFDCDELSRIPWKKNGELNFEEPQNITCYKFTSVT